MTPEAFARAYTAAVQKLREGPTPTSLIPSSLDVLAAARSLDLPCARDEILAFAHRYDIRLADLDD
jgi:hypothetical protein